MSPDAAVPHRRRVGGALLPLGLMFLAVGVSTAVVLPFLSLFLSTDVHAGPVRVTLFLIAAPLSGVVIATLLGRLSDRWPIRRRVLIGASLAGMLSMGLTSFVRDYWVLLALTATATALAGSLFPQTFAYARHVLAPAGTGGSALAISGLRTVFSLAWVAGPPLGSVLLRAGGFTSLYAVAAAMYAGAALVAIGWLAEVRTPAGPAPSGCAAPPAGAAGGGAAGGGAAGGGAGEPVPAGTEGGAGGVPRATLLLTAAGFTLLQCPLTLAVQALPLFISTDLGGRASDAGLILGLCAALEIPLMLSLGALAARVRLRVLVLAGGGCGVGYYALAAVSTQVWMLAAAQLLDALFIAAVSGLGISYTQELLPRQPGRATTLFTNSFPIGAMLAGPVFGLAQHLGYRLAYASATTLCAIGLAILSVTRPPAASSPAPAR
jgi:MFS transporter, SET family, sugar efflux transporter